MTTIRKPSEEYHFDFVVIGGGLAGMCAAIEAARLGAKTAIVHDRPVFGGNSSSEMRILPTGAAFEHAWGRETGLIEEFLLEERAKSPLPMLEHGLAGASWDLILLEAIRREPNLSMFLNTSIRAVEIEPLNPNKPTGDRKIIAVHGSQLGSEKELVFFADQFADCTGDATVGYLSGAEYRVGREARAEFDETLAPMQAKNEVLGSTLMFRARKLDHPVIFTPPPWARKYKTVEELGPGRITYNPTRDDFGGYWWVEICDPYDQIDDNQMIREVLLQEVLGVWDYIKNYSPDQEACANHALEWVGMIPAKRESRRLVGDVTITEHDCHVDPQWPDRVCYAGWFIDLHMKGGFLNKIDPSERGDIDMNYRSFRVVPIFSLPLRAFYSRNVTNLWMAGRNISTSHVAYAATRVMRTTANMGQAVGVAAGYAVMNHLTPRQAADPAAEHIARIQQTLIRNDLHVPGVINQDPLDLALKAKTYATSEDTLNFGNPSSKFVPLDRPRGQLIPVTHDHVETVDFYLKNENSSAVLLTAQLAQIERIWDQDHGINSSKALLSVPGNFEGWLSARFSCSTKPNKLHRVSLSQALGVGWAQATRHLTGTTSQYLSKCQGGPEPQFAALPSFQPEDVLIPMHEKWLQSKWYSLAVRVIPTPHPFGSTNVNNGCAWSINLPNLWVSDPDQALPQSITLEFNQKQTFNTVQVAFDTYLNPEVSRLPEPGIACTCVRDWRLLVKTDSEWKQVYEEKDNFQRLRIARFEPVLASSLKLEVLATNAYGEGEDISNAHDHSARIFEIRVYNE